MQREDEEVDNGADEGENATTENDDVGAMIQYFLSLQEASAVTCDDDEKEALAIIIDWLNNCQTEEGVPQAVPTNLFAAPKLKIRKAIIKFLTHRVPEAERQKRVGDATLKKWFSASNTARVYMFHAKDALIAKVARLSGVRLNSSLSIDSMIKEIVKILGANQGGGGEDTVAGEQQEPPQVNTNVSDISRKIMQTLLVNSFMKPLTSEAREHCKMGHKLELPIGKSWMDDFNNKKKLEGYKILSLHKVGLVAKKGSPWAKDSIDFVACIENKMDPALPCLELWGVEIKSRVKNATITREREHMRKLRRKKYEMIGSDKVAMFVEQSSERHQILHHAYVWGLEKVAIVIGDKGGRVISGTIVDYNENVLQAYGKVVDKIKDLALDWAYTDEPIIPEEVIEISERVPTINGKEALYGALKLWRALFRDTSILPYPTLKRIIPSTHAQWNATMGGGDALTKLVDDCFLRPPRSYTNFESTGVARCISNLFATTLKLHQITTADTELQYLSMAHYRNAASHRATYKKMLINSANIFEKAAKELAQYGEDELERIKRDRERSRSGRQRQRQPLREVPRRVQFQGTTVVPEQMDFASKKTFKTPQKKKKKQIETEGKVAESVMNRIHTCTGFPMQVVSQNEGSTKDPRRSCYICGSKTKWQCINCRFYFCMATKKTAQREQQLYYVKEKENVEDSQSSTKIYGKSCFHAFHESAIRECMSQHALVQKENK